MESDALESEVLEFVDVCDKIVLVGLKISKVLFDEYTSADSLFSLEHVASRVDTNMIKTFFTFKINFDNINFKRLKNLITNC